MSYETPQCNIPAEAYLYFPKNGDFRAKDGQRLIFDGNTQFDDYELKMISTFKLYVDKHKYTLKPMWTDNMILRFLYANNFKMERALPSIKGYTHWRETQLPVKADKPLQDFLDSGIIYVHGRDHKFRPIIVFNVYKVDPKTVDIELVTRALTYLFEYVTDEWMLPGQVENWVFVANVKGMSLMHVAVQSVRNMFMYLQDNFKCRLYTMYIINASPTVYIPWSFIKKFLDEATVQKVQFYKTETIPNLFKHTNREQVEQKFGGFAPNLDHYWPPRISSNNYFVSPEDAKALITKEHYMSLSSSGGLKNMRVHRALTSEVIEEEQLTGKQNKTYKHAASVIVDEIYNPKGFLFQSSRSLQVDSPNQQLEQQLFESQFTNKKENSKVELSGEDTDDETDYVEEMNENLSFNHVKSGIKEFGASFIANLTPRNPTLP